MRVGIKLEKSGSKISGLESTDDQRLVGLDCGFEKIQKSNPFLDWIWIGNPFWWIVGLSPLDWIANPIHEISLSIEILYLDPNNWTSDPILKVYLYSVCSNTYRVNHEFAPIFLFINVKWGS